MTCFYCNVTLKQWEKDDCIETEHLKWEPNCMFAKMVSSRVPFLMPFLSDAHGFDILEIFQMNSNYLHLKQFN